MSIGILTDSTADLSEDLKKKHNIHTIPLSVHFEDEVYTDGVDINPGLFFKKIKEANNLPGTSRPPVSAFKKKYREMADKYDKIVSLHVSDNLSGTLDAARMAARELNNIDIYTVDSSSISLGLGFLVIMTSELLQKGKDIAEIKDKIKKAKENLLLFFTVNDLSYMEKGGRIGKARSFLGSILNINPIISISTKTGRVEPLDKTRGQKRTLKKMVSLARKRLKNAETAWLGFAHGERAKDMAQFRDKVVELCQNEFDIDHKVFETRISPTLGCHVGPSVYAGMIFTTDFFD